MAETVETRGRKPGVYSEHYAKVLDGRIALNDLRIAKLKGEFVPLAEVIPAFDEMLGHMLLMMEGLPQKRTRDPELRKLLQKDVLEIRNEYADWAERQFPYTAAGSRFGETREQATSGRVGKGKSRVPRVDRPPRSKRSKSDAVHDPVGTRYRRKTS